VLLALAGHKYSGLSTQNSELVDNRHSALGNDP